jgi:hypothetical protein
MSCSPTQAEPCVTLFHASKQGPSPKLGAVGRSLLAIAPVGLVGVQGRSGSRSSLASPGDRLPHPPHAQRPSVRCAG